MAKIKRKTIEVGILLHRLNFFLASDKSTTEEREVMCTFVEGILMDTGNYEGYRYLPSATGDGTRRYYFASQKIQDDYDTAAAALILKNCSGMGV